MKKQLAASLAFSLQPAAEDGGPGHAVRLTAKHELPGDAPSPPHAGPHHSEAHHRTGSASNGTFDGQTDGDTVQHLL